MSLKDNFENIKKQFSGIPTQEGIYQAIIAWAKKLPSFDPACKTEENRVLGCQSLMYLTSRSAEGKLFFSAASDALISAGLAALLLEAYSGTTLEEVLTTPPAFLEELGITAALTPGRANGVASLYLKMKQEAVKHLLGKPALKKADC